MSRINEETPGAVTVSDDVLAAVVADAVMEVPGVVSMEEILTRKGVRITEKGKSIVLDLYINVAFGTKIPQLAWKLQKYVAARIRSVTGVTTKEINIHVQGVEYEENHSEKTESLSN